MLIFTLTIIGYPICILLSSLKFGASSTSGTLVSACGQQQAHGVAFLAATASMRDRRARQETRIMAKRVAKGLASLDDLQANLRAVLNANGFAPLLPSIADYLDSISLRSTMPC